MDPRGKAYGKTFMTAKRQPARPPKSNARFYSALAIVAVVGVAAISYVATHKDSTAASVPTTPPDPSTLGAAKGHFVGSPTAPVKILEFADFECPACGTFALVTEPDVRSRLISTGQVSYQFFDFPLPMHKNTWYASEAAACAEDQGKFWEMHDMLFQGQNDWSGEATDNPSKILKGYAKGNRRHVNQTPTFVIGTRQVPGALGYDQIKAYIDTAAGSPKANPIAAK
jgi:protein-disulfide isomerase